MSRSHRRRADEQRLEHALGHARLAEDLLDRQRALRHVGRVLQQHHVAGRQRGQAGAERLPEGKVPGHHREDHAERLEADVALGRGALDRLVGQQPRGVVGEPVGRPGALLDLGLGLDDRLAHLRGQQRRVARLVRPQDARRPTAGGRCACRCRRLARHGRAAVRAIESGLDRRLVSFGKRGQLPAGGRIDGFQHPLESWHDWPSWPEHP